MDDTRADLDRADDLRDWAAWAADELTDKERHDDHDDS